MIALAASLLLTTSCKNEKDETDPSQVITSGSWRVGHYMDSGNDETSDFIGYNFVFSKDGTLAATRNGITKNGIWIKDNSSNKLIIDLGQDIDTNRPLGELTDDWKITNFTSSEISLVDDSSPDEMLVFLKN